ncbi:MAG: hypothetical protein HUU50_14555 [Candidatus Brocadiae bacterium]|nr:hypothetical protein [Candidatus Brocadiia bacterium]
MEVEHYHAHCPSCHFTANLGILGLSPRELRSLLLLASQAGKVILVYASLKGIPASRTEEMQRHPEFEKKEYMKLLEFYNSLAQKCESVLEKQGVPITIQEILGK